MSAGKCLIPLRIAATDKRRFGKLAITDVQFNSSEQIASSTSKMGIWSMIG